LTVLPFFGFGFVFLELGVEHGIFSHVLLGTFSAYGVFTILLLESIPPHGGTTFRPFL
jgi:hypothetical protein